MARLEDFLDTVFLKQRWLIHLFFWSAVLLWYAIFFGRENSNYLQTLFFVGLLMPVTIATSYFLNYYLVPHFLLKEKYGLFVLYFIYTLIVSLFLETMISVLTFVILAEFNIRNMSPASIDLFFLLTSLLSVVLLALAIKLLLHWRKSKEDYQKLMLEKTEGELRFLKAQLNPHFLFNTLNNLYYLTTQKSDLAPKAILQLSEILDYVLYTGKKTFVPFEQEWHHMENYIALERLHYEDRLNIDTSIKGDIKPCMISPMILITLVENAFKHGVMKSKDKSWVRIEAEFRDQNLYIVMQNSTRKETNSQCGIGLQNLRGQLNLLYRDRHELVIKDTVPDQFSLSLTLKHCE